ncbi:hypothetical protein ACFV6D_37705 [Kitasatospora sp. NPDC059812]|uniref:hypothetical protein n=1 Tax=Kitasatospora sp. NPDC059812 TaxID=3346958 RepID=UPI0036590DC7
MNSPSEQAVGVRVRDLVRDVVAVCAPEEAVMVDGLLRRSDAEVLARLRRRRGDRDPLGFGLAEIAPLVAPLLWLTLDRAREKLAENLVEVASRGSSALWRRVRWRVRRRRSAPEVIPPLTRDQQRLVHRMVLEAAGEAGLSPDLGRRIADGVVAGLALADPDDQPDERPDEAAEGGPGHVPGER